MKDKVSVLLNKIKVLEEENAALTEKAEQALLLSLVSTSINTVNSKNQLFDTLLEQISILINLSFCAYFKIEKNKAVMENCYFSLKEETELEISFPVSDKFIKKLIHYQIFIPENGCLENYEIKTQLETVDYIPKHCSVLFIETAKNPKGFFLLCDNNENNRFTNMEFLFQEIIQITIDKLEKIELYNELKTLNENLEKKINERINEISEINRNLLNEIEERKQAEQKLIESESWIRSLYESATNISFITATHEGLNSRIISFSPGSEILFGYTAKEIIGKPLSILHTKESAKDFLKIQQQFNDNSKPLTEEKTLIKKSGEQFYGLLTIYPLKNSEKKVTSSLGICIDISDLKNAEKELIKAKEKAEESDRLKTSFLQNMSHEIRTPMNGIIGFAELLHTKKLSKEKRDTFTKIIVENGKQLLGIINDVLDLSKIETGLIHTSKTNFNLNQLTQKIELFFNKANLSENIELEIANGLPDHQSIIFTDETKLYQILLNLIKNAYKFSNKGKIQVNYVVNKDKLLFCVKDEGIGIHPEKQEVIFNRFRQADESISKNYGGTGIGLFLCKKYVEMLNGKIWVVSKPFNGSQFFFTIDYKPDLFNNLIPKKEGINNLRIFEEHIVLIAEDQDSNFDLFKEMTANYGIIILRARNGEEAIQICQNNKSLSIVFMDIKMPVLDGFKATTEIKKINSKLPVIALTAYAFSEDKEKAIQAGCDDYIPKPIKTNDLERIFQEYLQ